MVRSAIILCLTVVTSFGQFVALTDGPRMHPVSCTDESPYLFYTTKAGSGVGFLGYNVVEGFERKLTGFENLVNRSLTNAWGTYGDTSKIFPAYDITSLTTNKAQGSCDQALRFVFGTDGAEACASVDIGRLIDLDTTTNFIFFNFMVENIPPVADWVYIFGYTESDPSVPFDGAARIQRASATTFQMQFNAGSAGSTITLTNGVWYSIVNDIRPNGTWNYRVWVGDGAKEYPTITSSIASGSVTRVPNKDARYLLFGPLFEK
ncbi:MAG TPA: hypothetical protein VFU31_22705, partial [Candidatus Binatia bacterium]|nr:hypothetical protein [Candidatus Binatia bacterium]